jgi:malate-CoA ligase subunit beta
VAEAIRIVRNDDNVKAILINIFAGINRCDWVAQGIVRAMEMTELDVPLVVRLAGTNVAQGREILADSGLPITTASNLADAAAKAVAVLHGEDPAAADHRVQEVA